MKKALVTGGTRGISAGVARSLAAAGWWVIAASASAAELDAFPSQDEITVALLDVVRRQGFGTKTLTTDRVCF